MGGRLAARFGQVLDQGHKVLIPYLTAGDPDLETTAELCAVLERAGADMIELGLPFSDPLADGPVIQGASQRALAAGATTEKVLELAARVRRGTDLPIVLLTYYNPVFRYGLDRFVGRAIEAGVDALAVPDLPLEEGTGLRETAGRHGLDVVAFIAPTTTEERLQTAAGLASGFVYCVSVTGVTGARSRLSDRVEGLVTRMRQYTSLPLAVGFGVSTPQQVQEVCRFADGAIVGSAIVRLVGEGGERETLAKKVFNLVSELKRATQGDVAGR